MTREASTPAPVTPRAAGSRTPWLLSAMGTAVSFVALVAMAVTSLVSLIDGSASDTVRAVTEAVMLLVLAACVAVLVVALLRGKNLAKTPTLLWNGMLVPIGFSLYDGGAHLLGVATVVVAVLTFAVTLLVPRYEDDGEE